MKAHLSSRSHLQKRRLNKGCTSVLANVIVWSGEVSVKEGERGLVIGASPLHADQSLREHGKSRAAYLHDALGVGLGVVAMPITAESQ